MSEPLTRESEAWRKLTAIGVPNSASLKPKIAELIATLLAQLETLEKQRAADLEAQQAAMLACIREERVSKQAERDELRAQLEAANRDLDKRHTEYRNLSDANDELDAQLENSERFVKIANDTNADLRAQLEIANSDIRAIDGRAETLRSQASAQIAANMALRAQLEKQTEALHQLQDVVSNHSDGGDPQEYIDIAKALRVRCEQLQDESTAAKAYLDTLLARCGQLERELDLEKDRFADLLARTHDAESRCGQLEAALRDVVQASQDEWGNCTMGDCKCSNHIARAALENSTIAPETPAKEPA